MFDIFRYLARTHKGDGQHKRKRETRVLSFVFGYLARRCWDWFTKVISQQKRANSELPNLVIECKVVTHDFEIEI